MKPLLLTIVLLIHVSAQAFISTNRHDFEKEGFGVQVPIYGVTVQGKHFFERYEPLFDGSTTKKLNYIVDVTSKNSNQTELEYLQQLKQTLGSVTICEDLSDIKTTRNGYPYRSIKIKSGEGMINYYFFFRRDDLVVFSFQCLLVNENWLLNDINAAVDNFMWLAQPIDIKEMNVGFKLPYEMNIGYDESKNKITFVLTDAEYSKKTNFRASVEFIAEEGNVDSVRVRKAFDNALKAQASKLQFDYRTLGTTKVNPNLVCDKYVLYNIEKGKQEGMRMSVYQFYTATGIIRFTHSEYDAPGNLDDYLRKLLASIKYTGPN